MVKLYAQLESALKVRINSNDEIILALKRLSEMGKLDKPKELAMFAIILDRLGKMEDDATLEESLKDKEVTAVIEELAEPIEEPKEEAPAVTEFNTENVEDPQPQITEPQTP